MAIYNQEGMGRRAYVLFSREDNSWSSIEKNIRRLLGMSEVRICQRPYPQRCHYQPPEKPINEQEEMETDSACSCASYTGITNHNQELDIWDRAKREGLLKPGGILIHFDTHSDLSAALPSRETIGDYVNSALIDGTFSEVYWVLPDWTKDPDKSDIFWRKEENPIYKGYFVGGESKTYKLYVNIKSRMIFINNAPDYDGNPDNYRIVILHKVTIEELPSLMNDNRQKVFSVDADYYSNTGFDTSGGASHNPSHEELYSNLDSFFVKLDQKGIYPTVVTLAKSPVYTAPEDIPVIKDYFLRKFRPEYFNDSNNNTNYPHFQGYQVARNNQEPPKDLKQQDGLYFNPKRIVRVHFNNNLKNLL